MKKKTVWILIVIGVIYFCAMIPGNLTGAGTPDMLELFEVDEFAQYPHAVRMLTKGETVYQSIRNFVVYQHYFYGYPFYFWSAIVLLPLKIFGGWPPDTRIAVCVLRQMLSVLPMILACGLLVWLATRFEDTIASVLLDIFLLSLPAVIDNNCWWHPDSLTLLFIVLTFFFLDRDRLQFGKNFLFGAFFCGAATGTKYLGLYFGLAIPLYLIFGMIRKKITVGTAAKKAVLFLLVMVLGILVSDPLLLLPQERADIIRTIRTQEELTGVGIFTKYDNAFLENGRIPSYLTDNYVRLWMLFVILAVLIWHLIRRENRVQTAVLCAYVILAFAVTVFSAARRLHYFLPVLLSLFAILGCVRSRKIQIPIMILMLLQIGLNLPKDVELVRAQLVREKDSGAISLYETVQEQLPLASVPESRMTRVYRDRKCYFPEQDGYAVKHDWDLPSFDLIEEWHPDLILLENAAIKAYADPSVLEEAVNPEDMAGVQAFYAAAAADEIPGYALFAENSYGKAWVKNQ